MVSGEVPFPKSHQGPIPHVQQGSLQLKTALSGEVGERWPYVRLESEKEGPTAPEERVKMNRFADLPSKRLRMSAI